MPPVIRSIDDAVLAEMITAAKQRVVFVAPGVSDQLATALAAVWERLGKDQVSIVLDADPGACRLGYGIEAALKRLHETAAKLGTVVSHQPQLRVGVVVTEHETLIFSPTPLLIETGSKPGSGANAISLPGSPPPSLARDLGLGPNGVKEQVVGLDPLTRPMVKKLSEDLKTNPPLPFDISRQVMVFNAKLEFVEFTVAKIQVQRIDIPVPPDLMRHASTNLHTLFRFDPGDVLTEAKELLENEKKKLEQKFTRPAKGFSGSLIERSRKKEFLAEVARFTQELETFRELVKTEFNSVAAENQKRLHDILLPPMLKQPPDGWLNSGTAADRDKLLAARLSKELSAMFKNTGDRLVSDMRVSVLFKGVTYECITSKEFLQIAQKAFPHLHLMHEEYQAAPEGK